MKTYDHRRIQDINFGGRRSTGVGRVEVAWLKVEGARLGDN